MKTILENPTPRIDKTLEWLNQSRDQWKEKCLLAKTQLKRQKLATKRLRAAGVIGGKPVFDGFFIHPNGYASSLNKGFVILSPISNAISRFSLHG